LKRFPCHLPTCIARFRIGEASDIARPRIWGSNLSLRRRTLLLQPALNGSSRPPSFCVCSVQVCRIVTDLPPRERCPVSTRQCSTLHRSTFTAKPSHVTLRSNLLHIAPKVTAIVLTCRVLHRVPTWPSLVASMNGWKNCAFPTLDRRTTSIPIPAIPRRLEARTPSFPPSRRLRTMHGRACSVASQLIRAKSRAQRLGHNIHK
jgi:hypothetical protein